MSFAKIFDRPEHGQFVLMLDVDDDGAPALRGYLKPAGLGVCTLTLSWPDADKGEAHAQEQFDNFSEDQADAFCKLILRALPK